jgi:hypothetical protein
MFVGSAPSELKLGSTTVTGVRLGAGLIYDSDVVAFQKSSGATQVGPILALVDYLKTQNLWSASRFYPMKSAQNAGSGSTVYALGGLTSNNMTLFNSPTWGSDGVTFNGSTQYGSVNDIFDGGDLTLFARVAFATDAPTALEGISGTYRGDVNQRSFFLGRSGGEAGDPLEMSRSSNGTGATIEVYRFADSVPSTEDECVVAEWLESDSRSLWQNKTQRTGTLASGAAQSSTHNSSQEVFFAAIKGSAVATNHASLTGKAFLVISGVSAALTTAQRETITDLINAL